MRDDVLPMSLDVLDHNRFHMQSSFIKCLNSLANTETIIVIKEQTGLWSSLEMSGIKLHLVWDIK